MDVAKANEAIRERARTSQDNAATIRLRALNDMADESQPVSTNMSMSKDVHIPHKGVYIIFVPTADEKCVIYLKLCCIFPIP